MSPPFKERSEQILEYLEGLKRPLTDEESDLLRRSMHAVYCLKRARRLEAEQHAGVLAEHERGNAEALASMEREALR